MERLIKKIKPKIIIHAAAVSRPMDLHEKEIERSIKTNKTEYFKVKYLSINLLNK